MMSYDELFLALLFGSVVTWIMVIALHYQFFKLLQAAEDIGSGVGIVEANMDDEYTVIYGLRLYYEQNEEYEKAKHIDELLKKIERDV